MLSIKKKVIKSLAGKEFTHAHVAVGGAKIDPSNRGCTSHDNTFYASPV
ncbi:hypothetical protein L1077_15645 [Pseudoalteromonas luteoviolacea]|nr:hypothetical protein [Pseudoalteromonas luteoviolacea]MCF6440871.1 hypothetical protein [Pseudoalteromonas luteoviolacea]